MVQQPKNISCILTPWFIQILMMAPLRRAKCENDCECVACSLTHIAAELLILAKKPYPSMNSISEQVMGSITASVVLLERHTFPSHALLLSSNIIFTTVVVLELGLTLTKNSPGLPFEGDPIILTHPSGNDCTRIERLATTRIVRNTADMLSIFPHKLHKSAWISTSVQLIYRN